MKCVLCRTVLRGDGSLLLGKHCACSSCVKAYRDLEELGKQGDETATGWLNHVKDVVEEYKEPEPRTKGPLAYAEKKWKGQGHE